jgi:hypothetical protein
VKTLTADLSDILAERNFLGALGISVCYGLPAIQAVVTVYLEYLRRLHLALVT